MPVHFKVCKFFINHTCTANMKKKKMKLKCRSYIVKHYCYNPCDIAIVRSAAADVKMEIPVLQRSLKSSILSSSSFRISSWGVVSAAVGWLRRKANMVTKGDGKFGPWGWPQNPYKPKKVVEKHKGMYMVKVTSIYSPSYIFHRFSKGFQIALCQSSKSCAILAPSTMAAVNRTHFHSPRCGCSCHLIFCLE